MPSPEDWISPLGPINPTGLFFSDEQKYISYLLLSLERAFHG